MTISFPTGPGRQKLTVSSTGWHMPSCRGQACRILKTRTSPLQRDTAGGTTRHLAEKPDSTPLSDTTGHSVEGSAVVKGIQSAWRSNNLQPRRFCKCGQAANCTQYDADDDHQHHILACGQMLNARISHVPSCRPETAASQTSALDKSRLQDDA